MVGDRVETGNPRHRTYGGSGRDRARKGGVMMGTINSTVSMHGHGRNQCAARCFDAFHKFAELLYCRHLSAAVALVVPRVRPRLRA
jgi:hypothetical protein